jgi:hypothetical protein
LRWAREHGCPEPEAGAGNSSEEENDSEGEEASEWETVEED